MDYGVDWTLVSVYVISHGKLVQFLIGSWLVRILQYHDGPLSLDGRLWNRFCDRFFTMFQQRGSST